MSITVYTGPMFSSKSDRLLEQMRRYEIAKRRVMLFKPAIDDRYDETKVVSHSGQGLDAIPLASIDELWGRHLEDVQVLGLDEVQFFFDPLEWIDKLRALSARGVVVYVAGLDMDFMGKPFETTKELMAVANKVYKQTAICMECGQEAMYTQRIVDGKEVTEGESIQVGGVELYEPRCASHFKHAALVRQPSIV